MLKRVAVVVVLAVVLGALSSGPVGAATSFTPRPGPTWNNPQGDYAARNVNMAKVRNTIDSVPRGGVIRIAVYSYNRRDIGDALIRACKRRVSVQLVLNDNAIGAEAHRMMRYLGQKTQPRWKDRCHPRKYGPRRQPYPVPSFSKVCQGACRLGSDRSNQHSKFYLFSASGNGKPVVMFGSNNLMSFAAHVHWNDLYTVLGNQRMFDDFSTIFAQMAQDQWRKDPYVAVQDGKYAVEFGSDPRATGSKDHVYQRLDQVGCRAPAGYGDRGHTTIRIMMYGWVGERGLFLARKVAALSRSGCRVRVLVSGAGRRVHAVLHRSGVAIRRSALDLDDDPLTGFDETGWEVFSHEKWMSLSGTWAGEPFKGVWTGSENWSDVSRYNDEVTVQVPFASALAAYNSHFETVWTRYSA
ncbi:MULTISPECIES: phospholipase D-like domain-containing protein [unclassified Nocardioides]|uniref:phospholipase D-like domain-containing protein n=1 Tax=unclassified Nocardioides TaxID=2615069 RepID=UPI0002F20E16|nr:MULTISPECIES: phospholipase D-like domain-containing protein [unclassified Nocardioides]